jgi:hypothetical protein
MAGRDCLGGDDELPSFLKGGITQLATRPT